MADKVAAGHVGGANGAREAVCIHTKKIYSSCRDKDCIEDLRFYPTATAQSVLSTAQGPVSYTHLTLPTKRIV